MANQKRSHAAMYLLMELDEKDAELERKDRKYWVGPLCSSRKTEGQMNTTVPRLLHDGHRRPGQFSNYFRMDQPLFDDLLAKIEPIIQPIPTNMRDDHIPARSRLGVTLRYLATGHSYADLFYAFRISTASISGIIHQTCEAIFDVLKDEYLQMPSSPQEWKEVADGFLTRWNYPQCVGAIDGKHIVIRKPVGAGSEYHNYKGTESVVLMAVADAKQRFIYVDVGSNGRASDGGVWKECSLDKAIREGVVKLPQPESLPPSRTSPPIPHHFVADEAFPLTAYIMKPFPRRNLTHQQKIFNYRLSRARRIIENSFGRLAAMFKIYQSAISIQPDPLKKIILATCVLHNYIIDHNPNVFTCDTDAYIEDGSWRAYQSGGGMLELQGHRYGNRCPQSSKDVQGVLSDWFNGEGAVSWQDKMVDYAVDHA